MGSTTFTFTEQDVLCVSLSLNALYFLQLVTSRIVNWLLPVLSPRWSRGRTLQGIHQRWPNLLGRLLMEQASLIPILILTLINLGFVSSVVPPFSHHPEDNINDNHNHHDNTNDIIHYNSGGGYNINNNNNNGDNINNNNNNDNNDNNNNNNDNGDNPSYHQLTRVILSASAARFLIIAIGIVQHGDTTPIRIASTDTRNSHIDLIYCVFSIASNIIGMGFKQNLLLLVTSSFMELNTTSLVICRLIKLADRHRCCRSYLKTSVLCCACLLFSRVLLPVLFLCHALSQESPFIMDNVPLVWFFISGVLYSVFHAIFIFFSVRRIVRASAFLSEGASHTCAIHEPFSVSERLINDIYNNCDESPDFDVMEKDSTFDRDEVGEFKCKPSTKLRDLNYGFLAPYDNRNLCSFVTGVEEEKINFLQKKNISKNELVYKFLIKGGTNGGGDGGDNGGDNDNKMPSRARCCQQCNIGHESHSGDTSSGSGHDVEYYCKELFEMRAECDATDDAPS